MNLSWRKDPFNRRFDGRIPLEMHISTYLNDQHKRGFTSDISESGLYLNTLIQDPHLPRTPLGLEFKLPGMSDSIWAVGEMCRDKYDDFFYSVGLRFTRMANSHQRMLTDYCRWQRRIRSAS
jgi:hypothetical protein